MSYENTVFKNTLKAIVEGDAETCFTVHKYTWGDHCHRKIFNRLYRYKLLKRATFAKNELVFHPTELALKMFRECKDIKQVFSVYKKHRIKLDILREA